MQISFGLLDPYSMERRTCFFLFQYLSWFILNMQKSLSLYLVICACARLRQEGQFIISIYKFDAVGVNLSIDRENLRNSIYRHDLCHIYNYSYFIT